MQLGWAGLVRHGLPAARLDAVRRATLEAGTVRVAASAGALLRWGAPPEGPTWPGEPSADWGGAPDGVGRWHVFAGADLRAVAVDRLLDGPASGCSPAVRPEPFGGEVFGAVQLRWSAP